LRNFIFILSLLFSAASIAQPSWQWANAINSTQDEKTLDITTVLTSGETYACGYFDGDLSAIFTLGLNGTPNMNSPLGVRDGFVSKYDNIGNLIWAFRVGGAGATVEIEAITDAPNGNIYVTGEFFDGSVDFQGVTSSISSIRTPTGASKNMFLAAYNSSGELLWATSSTDTGNSIGFGITADVNGIYVAGRFAGDITFPPLAPETWSGVASYFDGYVAKFDFSGNAIRVKTIFNQTGDGFIKAFNVTTDGTDVYAIGTSSASSWSYGPTGVNPTDNNNGVAGTDDIWVISLMENNFNLNWSQVIGSVEDDIARGVTNDVTGLYLTGGLGGASINFPGVGAVASIGTAQDIFSCKLFSASGNTDWVFLEQNNSTINTYGSDIVIDAAGDLYISGCHTDITDFNGGLNSIPTSGGLDVFVMSRKNTGVFNWALSAGSTGNDEGLGIGVDNAGGTYIGGFYDLASTFGTNNLPNDLLNNGFVAKLNTCSLSIICPANQTVTANPTCQYTLLDYTALATPFASCGIATVKQLPIAGTVVNSGVNPVTVYLTDNNGNVDSCTFDVIVESAVNPTIVSCGTWLANETTVGSGDTENNFSCVGFGTPGEDVYYQITVPAGNYWMQFNIDSVVDANDSWVETFWIGGSCPLGGGCINSNWYNIATQQFSTGGNSVQYLAVGPGTYYFVVDAQVDGIDSYNIGFNCLDGGIEFDTSLTCGDPNNDGIIPYVNGSTTLTEQPCQSVNICHDMFIANQQDFEWIDSVYMNLGPCYTNVVPTNVAGFYQPGNWVGTYDGPSSSISWEFNNTSNPSFGDGSSGNYSCDLGKTRLHTLCFTADISSTCVADSNLNISILISDDAIGSGGGSVASVDYVLSDDFTITNSTPTVTCPSNITVNNNVGTCGAVVNGLLPVFNDNCPGAFITYSLTGETIGSGLNDASGTVFNVGTTTVQYIVNDSLGLQDSCSFTVTVIDNEAPMINCPPNGTVANDIGVCTAIVNGIAPTSFSENCTVDSISYVLTGVTVGGGLNDASGSTFNLGVTTVTYTITDTSGNSTSCNFTITVTDVINPTITCPGNVVVNNDVGICGAIVNGLAPTPSDNCGIDSVSYILSGATVLGYGLNDVSGITFNLGITTVTYTVTDLSGNTGTCNFTVTVNDNESPTVNCLGNMTINSAPNMCSAVVNGISPIGFNDNCAVTSVSYTLSGATVGSGLNDASGTTFNLGATTVVYTASDGAGNTGTCSFPVIVFDNEAPSLTCPANVTVNNIPGTCSAIVTGLSLIAAGDNCSIDSISYVLTGATLGSGLNNPNGESFNLGITTLTYTVTDQSGNTNSCNFTVTVIDNDAPTIICPSNVSISNDVGNCSAVVNGLSPTPFDNCGIDSVNYVLTGSTIGSGLNDASGITFNAGVTTVTYMVTDLYGNNASCNFTVTVIDNEAPTITCPLNINLNNDAGICGAVVNSIPPNTISENCLIDSVNYVLTGVTTGTGLNDASGTLFNVGITTVSYVVTDTAGNTASCNFTVTVIDNEVPSFTCPPNKNEFVDFNCDFSIPDYTNTIVGLSDNCTSNPLINITQAPVAGLTISGNGTIQNITLYASDLEGNIDSCSFVVTLVDTIKPTIVCNGDTIGIVGNNCSFTLPSYSSLSVSDNCTANASITMSQSPLAGTIIFSDTLVTLTADDGNGNLDTCSFMVFLSDTISPDITCPSDTVVNNDLGVCGANVTLNSPVGSDNCSIISLLNDFNGTGDASDNYPPGLTTVTWTILDNSSNAGNCSFDVTIIDTEEPVITCVNDTVLNTDNNSCNAIYNYTVTAFDNCFYIINQIGGLPSGSSFPQGVTTNTFVATDSSGLADTCSFDVTVVDNQSPTITCLNDTVLCNSYVTIPLPNIGDNCMVGSIINDFNSTNNASDNYPTGITIVRWTVTDTSGNTNECVMTVQVDMQPTIADAGKDQHVLINETTNFEANSPTIGVGGWSSVSGTGIIDDILDPLSLVSDLHVGDNIFKWTIVNGTCPESFDEVNIIVGGLNVPSGFSPNDDNKNDFFVVPGLETFNNEVVIFNRWGVELFQEINYQNNWNGKSEDGKALPEDTYFYTIKLTDFGVEYSGYVVIKR